MEPGRSSEIVCCYVRFLLVFSFSFFHIFFTSLFTMRSWKIFCNSTNTHLISNINRKKKTMNELSSRSSMMESKARINWWTSSLISVKLIKWIQNEIEIKIDCEWTNYNVSKVEERESACSGGNCFEIM